LRFEGVAEYADQRARNKSCASFVVEEEDEDEDEDNDGFAIFYSLHYLSLSLSLSLFNSITLI